MPAPEHPSDAPETWTWAAFDALAAPLAVLEAQGTIVAVNAVWERFGRTHAVRPVTWTGMGSPYGEVDQREPAVRSAKARTP